MPSQNWSVSQLCTVNTLIGLFTAGILVILRKRITGVDREAEHGAIKTAVAGSDLTG